MTAAKMLGSKTQQTLRRRPSMCDAVMNRPSNIAKP
jgi:hypothetical protein